MNGAPSLLVMRLGWAGAGLCFQFSVASFQLSVKAFRGGRVESDME